MTPNTELGHACETDLDELSKHHVSARISHRLHLNHDLLMREQGADLEGFAKLHLHLCTHGEG